MAKKKSYWESKTFWANVLLTLSLIVELVVQTGWVSVAITAFIANVINVVLRVWFTNLPVKH